MRILFFTKGNQSVASSRQRVWRVAERFKRHYGWEYHIIHGLHYSIFLFSFKRLRTLYSIFSNIRDTKYEILFVHKSFFPWDVVFLILIAKIFFRKKLIYDLDDAEWIHSPQKSAMLAKHADRVFCGSHEILSWAQKLNTHAVLVPTALNDELYRKFIVSHDHVNDNNISTIGWIGQGKAHFKAGNFAVLKKALLQLHEKHRVSFRLVIGGSQNYEPLHAFFSHVPFEVVFIDEADWLREDTVPKIIHNYSFQVGVMPLEDTLFNRAKCAFKALEYMACGVPVVASPVGEAHYIIKNGVNGFLVENPEEWAVALEKILKDAQLRKRMGEEGLKLVQERYSYEKVVLQMHDEIVKL